MCNEYKTCSSLTEHVYQTGSKFGYKGGTFGTDLVKYAGTSEHGNGLTNPQYNQLIGTAMQALFDRTFNPLATVVKREAPRADLSLIWHELDFAQFVFKSMAAMSVNRQWQSITFYAKADLVANIQNTGTWIVICSNGASYGVIPLFTYEKNMYFFHNTYWAVSTVHMSI